MAAACLQLVWEGVQLQHCAAAVYLGVTLNSALSYRQYVVKLQGKLQTRNSLLRKLIQLGELIRPQCEQLLLLCVTPLQNMPAPFGKGRYGTCKDSRFLLLSTKAVDVTGCIRSTNIDSLYILVGIAPLAIRRTAASRRERSGQIEDPRHPYRHCPARQRLQSRKSFTNSVLPLTESPEVTRLALWNQQQHVKGHYTTLPLPGKEQLPPGSTNDWLT